VLLWHYLRQSPEGNAYKHTTELWSFLRREQAHRHALQWDAWEETKRLAEEQRDERKMLR
jgi:hypothetical protein